GRRVLPGAVRDRLRQSGEDVPPEREVPDLAHGVRRHDRPDAGADQRARRRDRSGRQRQHRVARRDRAPGRGVHLRRAVRQGGHTPSTRPRRAVRDDTPASSGFGRWLTTAYYATLGKLGAIVHGHVGLRMIAAIVLLPVIALALAWHLVTLPGLVALALLGWL